MTASRFAGWIAVVTVFGACFDSTEPILPADNVDVTLLPLEHTDSSWATRVAADGAVVGSVADAQGRRGYAWQGDTVIRLGTLGGPESVALDVNTSGWVVGGSAVGAGRRGRAFLFRNGQMEQLADLGGDSSLALDVNEAGRIVGWSEIPTGLHRAVIWENGTIVPIVRQGVWSEALAVNEVGQVMGWMESAPGRRVGFLYSAGSLELIEPIGGNELVPLDLNEVGQVVGWSSVAHAFRCTFLAACRAFLWDHGTLTDLGTLGGQGSKAEAINDDGVIIGSSSTADGEVRAFRRRVGGELEDLGTLGGNSFAVGINNRGTIIGYSVVGGVGHAYAWRDGHMRLLRTLGLPGSRAWDINERTRSWV